VGGTTYYLAARPVAGQAFVLLRKKRLDASLWPFAQGLLLAGLAGALLAAALSVLLARAIRRPVVRVADATRSLAQGEPHVELPVEGSGELAELASSFNDMAAQLARAREVEQAFLLSVSHELKTPLTSIRGYAEGLVDGALPPAEAGETIRREAKRLERLVQDLLDLARLNRSTFQVHHEEVDLAEAARDAVGRYRAQAEAFGVELRLETPTAAPALADGDRALQVLSNLVENALRSTPAGGSVTVRAAPGLLEVADTGPGIEPADLPRAFERFFLYRRYGADRAVGTGLGLAIVKELTEAMGGSVRAESRPGAGTTFSVRLPLADAAVDDAALEGPGRVLPEQDEAAAPAQELGEREILREPVVALGDGNSAAGGAAVRDGDDVVLHRRLDRPA
jgi:two-component system sensor histidine kinase BaeS